MTTTAMKPDRKATCKARLHTILENDHISVCKFFSKHSHPSHPSKPKDYQATAHRKEMATNSQSSRT